MFAVSIPNSATRSAFVETATKCLAIAAGSPSWSSTQSRAEVALVSVSSVPKVFDETMNSVSSAIQVPGCFHEIGRVDIGDEAERQVAVGVMAQGLVGHHRPQVGPADADVDDVADRLAGGGSWPELCAFTSDAYYEGRLHHATVTERRSLGLGNGARWIPVSHEGHGRVLGGGGARDRRRR